MKHIVKNSNDLHIDSLSTFEKLGLSVVGKVGTVSFFIILVSWTIIWLGWNMFAPNSFRFDPFPGFVLWLFLSNVLQLILLPLVMIAQNLQSKHEEITAENDYNTDLQNQKSINFIKDELSEIKDLLNKI
jgi:uncharacterized membrane protein